MMLQNIIEKYEWNFIIILYHYNIISIISFLYHLFLHYPCTYLNFRTEIILFHSIPIMYHSH